MKTFKEILTESGKEISATILQQLGGNKFTTMTGAKNLTYDKNSLNFKIGKNKSKAVYVKISLDKGKDLYDLIFMDKDGKELKSYKGIYSDQLTKTFTSYTGLHTSL